MEQTEKQVKKKRKRMSAGIVDVYLEEESETLTERLINTLRSHVGKQNAIDIRRLFFLVYKRQISEIEFYKAYFYLERLRNLISYTRKVTGIQIISEKGKGVYVLKTKEEYEEQKAIAKERIEGLQERISSMDEWVKKEKWRNF